MWHESKNYLDAFGGGTCAPLFITVSDWNDREMPPGKDLLVLKVPGLCIGCSGVGSNAQHGYVVFMRRGGGVDKMRFQFYQKHVLIPYINWLRKEYAGFDISVGSNIPDELTAVSWCDGDLSQMYSVTNEHSMLNDQKVIANKQNAARTAVEQAADWRRFLKSSTKKQGDILLLILIHHGIQ